jgi:hypothetical protein
MLIYFFHILFHKFEKKTSIHFPGTKNILQIGFFISDGFVIFHINRSYVYTEMNIV